MKTSPDKILEAVSDFFQLKESTILGKSRQSYILEARHYYFYFARNFTNATLKEIGKGKTPTTVLNGINQVSHRFIWETKFRNQYELLKLSINQYLNKNLDEKTKLQYTLRKISKIDDIEEIKIKLKDLVNKF